MRGATAEDRRSDATALIMTHFSVARSRILFESIVEFHRLGVFELYAQKARTASPP